ncbi:uncharacterized protein F4807DRAFT_425610 [Annulohypoxylon truncatum]|uniref:uncharacterized protein n=1 Tax=Annulohypoxylon truncatum TaxID=327061 RepID=UPI002007201D|nr:uncharacterized protein F4807DRAFT_425610 [Annulohypoxylon truncatum]KAI1209614.1 hypothetical protein F4807DRAFT_425610 [Annulohypoxylon truncatum]
MDSSSNRGRGRKRPTSHISPPPSSPPQKAAQELPDLPSVSDASGPSALLPLSLETPSPSAPLSTRMRTRQAEGTNTSPVGRSLRKRPRVDYTFEQQDAENSLKLSSSSPRSFKRRRTDVVSNENELDDDSEARSEARSKRRASEQPQSSFTRKRIAGKGPVDQQTFAPAHHDDVEVQDTIEVGGHHSEESDESLIRRASSGSSSHDNKAAPGSASSESADNRLSQSKQSPSAPRVSLLSRPLPLPPYEPLPRENVSKRLRDRVQVNISGEMSEDTEPTGQQPLDMDNDQNDLDSLSHLTPYIRGSYTFYPQYPEDDAEPEADLDRDSCQVDADVDLNADADPSLELDRTAATNGQSSAEDIAVEDKVDGPVEQTPADTAANSPSGEVEATPAQAPQKKRYRFNQIRPASEYTDLFKDIKSLSTAELYRRIEVANEAMVAWQEEFRELKKITDDYDNSVRYKREEESFQRRSNMMASRNPSYNPIAKDFVVKGERAQDNTDPLVKYMRQQDKIQADAWGFEYDPRPDKIGNQNPIAQRTGAGRQGRLRERPKQTAKAAELDEPIVLPGKRIRKAPERFAGDEVISRGSTPVPTQRRGRRHNLAPENGEQNPPQPQSQAQQLPLSQPQPQSKAKGQSQLPQSSQPEPQPQALTSSFSSSQTHAEVQDPSVSTQDHIPAPAHAEKDVPKKKGKGGRPRKNPIPEPVAEAEPTTAATIESMIESQSRPEPKPEPDQSRALETRVIPHRDAESEPESSNPSTKRERDDEEVAEEQSTRKRRRRAPPSAPNSIVTLTLAPPPAPAAPVIEDNVTNGTEPETHVKSTRRRITKKTDTSHEPPNTTTNTSFTAPVEEPRPRTASSTATVDTTASTNNYQLREKRQRKFTNDIIDDDFIEEPKRKRARRASKKPQVKKENILPAPEPSPVKQPEPEVPALPKPPTRIRIKGMPNPLPNPTLTPASSTPSLAPSTNLAPANLNNLINGNSNGNGNVVGNGTSRFDAADTESRAEPPKDYSTMTKSEKMSASMKARWASGSMGNAVLKRRATLAAKKQSAKPSEVTNAAAPDQAPTSGSTHQPESDEDIDDDHESVTMSPSDGSS